MADFRFEEQDPVTGIITRWYVDSENDKVITETINPATQSIIDRNQALNNAAQGQRWGDGKIFASVPTEIARKHLWEAIQNKDDAYIKRWLNDSDHQKFRRFPGKV